MPCSAPRLFSRAGLLTALLLAATTLVGLPAARGQAPTADPHAEAIRRIREEGLNRSQIAPTLEYLSDVIGPRLTGSPGMKRANEWTRAKLAEWGLKNCAAEPWGEFGRGWSLERFALQVTAPQCIPLAGIPAAWSPGTSGPVRARVVHLKATTVEELTRYRGKLSDAIVLAGDVRAPGAPFEPAATRRTDAELLDLASALPGQAGRGRGRPGGGGPTPQERAGFEVARRRLGFLIEEGAAALLTPSRVGDAGAVFVSSASVPQPPGDGESRRQVRPWDPRAPKTLPQVVLPAEQFNRLARMLAHGEKLEAELDLKVRFHDDDLQAYNTVGEISGSDLAEELVMLGGHLDSWHGGTGATDNATGVVVCMEAARLIQTLGLKPRRTVRVALWTGEEQGLLGSRAYVAKHFRSAPTAEQPEGVRRPAYDQLSAYYNLDVGTGRIRGIFLEGQEALRPLFQQWLAPFRDLGASTVSARSQGGTDHLSFQSAGLPGFTFIQDPIDYHTRTHHSNLDVYDRAVIDDLKQAAVVMAAFVYQTAMRDQKLPRRAASPPAAAAE